MSRKWNLCTVFATTWDAFKKKFVENKMSPILLITMVTATIVRTRALNAASLICVTRRDAVKKDIPWPEVPFVLPVTNTTTPESAAR